MVELPEDFVPFRTLVVCGNTFTNGQAIFDINGNSLLLVGNGDVPQLWLFKPDDSDLKNWSPLVVNNRSLVRGIIRVKSATDKVSIYFNERVMVSVSKQATNRATVDTIDLRPLGLSIFGSVRDGLTVGGTTIKANNFTNVPTMVGLST